MALAAAQQQQADPMRELLTRFSQNLERITQEDPDLAKRIESLVKSADRRGQTENAAFRTNVAYALQDAERIVGPLVPLNTNFRAEMNYLATTFPGLRNDAVGALLRETPGIEDRGTVREIRKLAADSAKLGAEQNSPEIASRVDVIENKLRNATPATGVPNTPAPPESSSPRNPTPLENQPPRGGDDAGTERVHPSPGGGGDPAPPPAGGAPGRGATNDQPTKASPAADRSSKQEQPQQMVRAPGALSRLLHAMTAGGSFGGAEDANQGSLAERHTNFRETVLREREDKTLTAGERAGEAALAALRAFARGPGSDVMSKIQDAAKTDPDGMRGVMSGMREGGRYQDLRQQFEGARAQSQGFAAAYESAAAAVGDYGARRADVAAIATRRGETDAVNSRFERLDAAIGEQAAATPGRTEGKSLIDEIGEKVRALIDRAVQSVKNAFSPRPTADAAPSPAP